MTAAFLAWLVPVFVLPFVNVLPYLHTRPITQRLALSTALYLLLCVVTRGAMTRSQWNAVRGRTLRTWKEVLGAVLGLMMAVYLAANLSGNTLGLLARFVPGNGIVRDLVVVKSKNSGSNFKAVELQLASPTDQQFYEIVLSKRIFGEMPKVVPGDVIRFEAIENIFGIYVTGFSIMKSEEI